ncbi:MAG: lysophospholipid acyltransferase family protein [Candidatus Marinimicrobia bacterium]|nr:lysophospholipid acyltransferase family protein [Candidatus Neomarinimicrobiota bacterium]
MRNWLEYIPFLCIATLVRVLPRPLALNLGKRLGQLAKLLQRRRVSISRDNLQKAFPEMSAAEVSATISAMFKHLGISFIDMLRVDQYCGQQDLDRYFEINDKENLSEALELGRGCIVLSAHLGFWEAGSFFMPLLGFETSVVTKPMRNPLVDAFFRRIRESRGNHIINSRKGARGILKSLRQHHAVCILLDQHLKGQGAVAAPFFGRPAHTTTIITQMATRYQIPLIAAFSYRQPDNTYRCYFSKMFILEGDLSKENILANTTLINQQIEAGIRQDISQWFWLHRRWRRCCEK